MNITKIIEENRKMNFGGPLALILKTTRKEVCFDGEANDNKEGLLMNSDDETLAYYSNNSVNKFYMKPIGGNFKNNSFKKSLSSSGASQKSVEKVEEDKMRFLFQLQLL